MRRPTGSRQDGDVCSALWPWRAFVPLRLQAQSLLHACAPAPAPSCRNVKIGDPLVKGISGGQAKRTNIGITLITNPRVMFLDEPASGLDRSVWWLKAAQMFDHNV